MAPAAATLPRSEPPRKGCGPRSAPAGTFRDYQAAHPSRPVLLVEIGEASLALDRAHKGSLYARAGLPDYWIVNLPDRTLEAYRDPEADPGAPFGWRYRAASVLEPGTSVVALARPDLHIQAIDLQPFQGFAPWWDRKCARSTRFSSESPASSCDMAPP